MVGTTKWNDSGGLLPSCAKGKTGQKEPGDLARSSSSYHQVASKGGWVASKVEQERVMPGMAEPASRPGGGGKGLPEHMQAACAKEPGKLLEEGQGKQQQGGRAGFGNLAGAVAVAKMDQMGPKGTPA